MSSIMDLIHIKSVVLVFVVIFLPVQGFPNTTAAVWPMSLDYSVYDYNHTLHGILQQVRFGDGPTGFKQTAMEFDGMMGSYASYTNEAPALDVGLGSFTVATHVWLKSNREGLILTWSGLKTFPNGLKVYIVKEALHVDLYSRDRGLEYGQLTKTFTFLRVTQQEWNFVGVSFDQTKNTISMFINELRRDIHLPIDFNFGVAGIETRGGIFFGGHPKLTSTRPLQGRMACSMLFRAVVDMETLRGARQECMATLNGTEKSGEPLGIWPLDNDYASSDLSGYNLHGNMRQYIHPDGPEGRKEGATTLSGQNAGFIDIKNTYNTLNFPHEISFFGFVYFDKVEDCDVNSWLNQTAGPVTDGPQLVIRSGTVNVKIDSGHYVTDLCVAYSHQSSPNLQKPGNHGNTSSCDDRLHVKELTWHFIGYTFNATTGIFTVWVDRVAVKYMIGQLPKLSTGAVLRLGGVEDDGNKHLAIVPVTWFQGRMAWMYVLARGVTVQEAYTIHQATYRKYILESKPYTPVTFWPLDQTSGLWDISRYNLPGTIHGNTYTLGPSFEEDTGIALDGTQESYLEVESRDHNLDLKSTVSVFTFVRQTDSSDSTVVEWEGDVNMTNGVQLLIKNGYVTVNLVRRGEKNQGNFFQGYPVVRLVWAFIGFTYDATNGLLMMWKDDQHPIIKNVGMFQIETRGNVYVGGRPTVARDHYKGDLSCFVVYGTMMQKTDVMYVRRNCQQRMYLFKSPISLYPLTKNYMSADLAGYGNNGSPQNLAFASGPDSTPDRSTLFLRNHGSKISVVNYERQLDLDRQMTLTVYIYTDDLSSQNATIIEWDGMAYSTKGLGLLIQNSRITASVYPKLFSLDSLVVEPSTWYMVGLTYHYYHSTLRLWAQKFGESQRAYMAEKLIEPQLLATRGNLVVGASPTVLGTSFSGRLACLMIYGRALSMNDGLAESKKCFTDYLTKPPTIAPFVPTHNDGGGTGGTGGIYPTHGDHPLPGGSGGGGGTSSRNKVMIPIIIVFTLVILLAIVIVFIKKRKQSGDRERYRHTRLLDGAEENGYSEYHDDWEDDQQQQDSHSLMNMGNVKRYNIVGTV